MRYLRINVITDGVTGELAFKLKDNAMYNNGTEVVGGNGLIIAHDIIEHQQGLKSIGTLEDELIALGGIVYVRGQTGELSGFMTAEQNIAYDIERMFEYFRGAKPYKKYPKRMTNEDYYELDMIDDICQKAKVMIADSDDYSEHMEYIKEYIEWTKNLMIYGVYLAQKRFGCEHEALKMFKDIEIAVNKHLPEYEGQEFILGYSRRYATMREVEDEYEW